MSDAAGTDNPAFANEDENGSKLENGGQQQAALNQDRKSADGTPVENGHQRSFISQHYVEPIKPSSEPCYKTETRIEVPADNTEKSLPEPKLNGVHGNGNNNDASFLNNSATSVQINDSGKKEQIEAVNLELVSMRPYTGNNIQTKGQEACEVPADPYEEYFVPVNEHRKYISRGPEAEVETTVAGVRFDLGPGVGREGLSLRDPAAGLVDYSHWLTALRGEKLYVTKDKRSRNSYWRRMAWGCALLVVMIAVIIAILAATGVFPTQEATEPLENFENSNTRQINEVQTAGSQEYIKDPPLSPPPLTSTFPPWPTTEETLFQIVPDALDGTLRLDDFNWNDDLSDIKSRVYRQVSAEIEKHLGNILQQTGSTSIIKVYDINKEGEVKFRISHPPRNAPEENQEYIEDMIRKNGNMIGQYHLNRLHVGKLIDQCEHSNLGCTGSCKYDYPAGIFVCTCNSKEILDQDGKTCLPDSDLSNVEMDDISSQSSTEPINDFQGRSRDPGAVDFEPRHPNTWENPDFKINSAETDTSILEPNTKHHEQFDQKSAIDQPSTSTTEHIFENDNFHWNEHSHHSIETTSETEPSIKPFTTEPTVQSFTVPIFEQEYVPSAEPEPIAEPEPTAESEPTAEPEPTVKSESVAEPEPTIKSEFAVEPESTAKPEPTIESESAAEPSAEPQSTLPPEITIQPELTVKSESTTVLEPVAESNPNSESIDESVPTVKSEIIPEMESTIEAEPITEQEFTVKATPVTESTAPISKVDSEIKSNTQFHYLTTEPYLESKTEIFNQPETTVKSISHDNMSGESSTQTSLLNDVNTTDMPKILIDSTVKNDSRNEEFLTTTVKTSENPVNNDKSLEVIPLISKNKSTVINDNMETKTETMTMPSYANNDDKSTESTTIETSLTTLNYENFKYNDNENITSVKPEESATEQFTRNPNLHENKEIDSTTEINLDGNLNNIQEKNFSDEYNLTKQHYSNTRSDVTEQSTLTTPATTVPIVSTEETELTTKSINNDRNFLSSTEHFHTIEINGISNKNPQVYSPKIRPETTTMSETTSTDIFTQSIPGYRQEYIPEPALQPDLNEKNVIEHMPTTVFPKVPKNFAHNVEPLKEPIAKTDDEHIMLIPKSEQPVEIHAIIPQLIPEQVTNKSLRAENSTTERNNGIVVNEDINAEKSAEDATSIGLSARPNDKPTAGPDEIQEHSTSHPLHPAIFPENSVDQFAGKPDDRPVEDMSPFLPDVHREKESMKKAPRLDKDEQDIPNPFETHIDDIITHRPLIHNNADRVNETETKDLLNDVNDSHSAQDEKKVDITKKAAQNHEMNIDNDANNIVKNDLNISEVINDTESKIQNVLQQDSSSKSINNGTEDIIDQKNSVLSKDNDEESKVIPLPVKDKSVDSISQTTMQSIDKETSEPVEIAMMTSAGKKVEEEVGSVAIESSVTSSEKPEENAVEDHYNDITDETLVKGYQHDNTDKKVPVKVIETSKKAVLNNIEPLKIPYNDLRSFDVTNKKNKTDDRIFTVPNPIAIWKDADMTDDRLTTQEPVLPMEIQQEMLTTIAIDKAETITVIDDKQAEKNTEHPTVDQSNEKEIITTTQATLETKTTAQVPILPEELQTTESEILTTMSSEDKGVKEATVDKTESSISIDNVNDEMKKNDAEKEKDDADAVAPSDAMDMNSTSERSMAATTVYENNVNIESGQRIETNNERATENATENAKAATTLMMSTTEKVNGVEGTSPMPNDITTTEDVRPVTELLDDTQPMIDYRSLLFTTIPPKSISFDSELPEEALRVIPLEKSPESKKKSIDKKGFDKYKYKKEKDLSLEDQNEDNVLTERSNPAIFSQTELPIITTGDRYEELNDSVVSSDLDLSIPRFIVADKDTGNILPASKLNPSLDKSENKDTVVETKPKNYPSFIPVSEEIIESVPVTEPYVITLRNYTYTHPVISPDGADSTAVNETANEGRANARANETAGQDVTFFSDQSFSDTEETEVERITEEPSRLTVRTSPLNVESTTAAINSSSEFPSFPFFSKCTTGQFQCVNGTSRDGAYCVSQSAKCDSEHDCSDGSDELNCEAEGCLSNFRCASGQCLKRHLVCNKIIDCDDGSDEHDCENWQCQSDEFRCPNGRCIPGLWQCDGRPDCEGHQDEYNCAESCENNQYLCPTEKWCIPQAWHCNGITDCANGEDEKLCDCALDQFKCQTGGCIPQVQVCDGIENCPDYSDEWGCLMANITADRNLTMETNTDSNSASELINGVPFLKIRQHDGDYRLVCSDGWSEEFSNSYCQALGFAGSDETIESPAWNRSQKILRLKTNPNYRLPLVTNLEEMEFCVSDKVVKVSCQEFTCGLHSAEEPTARSASGITANNEQWSTVALLKELEGGTACTASILGPMHALASYSCIYRHKNNNRWQLFAGGTMLKGHIVKSIVPYPQVKYNQFLYNHDIALIELGEPLVFSRNVSAICLPRQPIQPRQICVTVGWGFPMNEEMNLQQYLKFLSVPTDDSDRCNATSHYADFLTEHDICADKSPCYNDEGAPLMCASESQGSSERWEIQGLLSHHSRCSRGHPAIYSSLEPALSWLRETVPALRTQS
ncbi:uncharacterized protein LOC105423231 isoform X1 [Pogonomyrmex barbatus]|uniref:Uncharacterized protein LOC105423231 isoform X1 n=1 Tax=Pogonomyrmex barbatus TaxID=144034 RepID=A0A6I9VTI3_9HYME|nr:uncharacterized protein LOC105423231 isoform X1 [Pogonomyrmex barbatus]